MNPNSQRCPGCGHRGGRILSNPIMISGESSTCWKGTMQRCNHCGAICGIHIDLMATDHEVVREPSQFWREEPSDLSETSERNLAWHRLTATPPIPCRFHPARSDPRSPSLSAERSPD